MASDCAVITVAPRRRAQPRAAARCDGRRRRRRAARCMHAALLSCNAASRHDDSDIGIPSACSRNAQPPLRAPPTRCHQAHLSQLDKRQPDRRYPPIEQLLPWRTHLAKRATMQSHAPLHHCAPPRSRACATVQSHSRSARATLDPMHAMASALRRGSPLDHPSCMDGAKTPSSPPAARTLVCSTFRP